MNTKIKKTDEEWRKSLTPLEFDVTRRKGTEPPFSGEYNTFYEEGVYRCVACGAELFSSETKFNSHCGWPSFSDAIEKQNVILVEDTSHGMIRTEVRCANCDAHLGHLFDDGPKPTEMRYCINSASLKFDKKDNLQE